jgi:hypothetical protein
MGSIPFEFETHPSQMARAFRDVAGFLDWKTYSQEAYFEVEPEGHVR